MPASPKKPSAFRPPRNKHQCILHEKMKKILYLFTMIFLAIGGLCAQTAQSIDGDWTPDEESRLGDIKIKSVGNGKYKIKLGNGRTVTGEISGNTINASYEYLDSEYGEFWVDGRGDILHGHSDGGYGSFGAASGWYSGNEHYRQTNSRYNCATVENSYCMIRLEFRDGYMAAYYKLVGEYMKSGRKMFYQESNWTSCGRYTQW